MTTKHAPATPLPFKYLPDEGQFIVDANGQIVAEVPCQGVPPEHGEYLTHAANAYQRLVERVNRLEAVLKNAERLAWEVGSETEDGVHTILEDSRGDLWREITSEQDANADLLRELGELK